MNKETFLEELRGYLQILEDQEQDDILEEYAQHIDMKLQKGLGEEEAISDFGPVKKLAAEILEAYHVKPEFQKKKAVMKLPGLGGNTGGGKNLFERTGRFLKEKFAAIIHSAVLAWKWTAGKGRAFAGWLTKPFRKGKGENAHFPSFSEKVKEEKGRKQNSVRGTGKMRNFLEMTGRGIMSLWRMCVAFCIFWLRLFWNMAWLMFSAFCAFMAMIVLMGVGTMFVFLLKGYPIFGIFTVCIGGLLCFGTLSVGAFGFIIRKKKDGRDTDEGQGTGRQTEGEVQYE